MKEVKYVSHILRNVYLFFIFIFSINLINKYQFRLPEIVSVLIIYLISYIPVYFLNDYSDRFEDIKYKKANLYNEFSNKVFFWILTFSLVIIGLLLSLKISLTVFLLLILLYFLNSSYSFKPFRFKDRSIMRSVTIFFIYFVKMFYLTALLYSSIFVLPLLLIIMSALLGSISVSLYKRHIHRSKISENIFGSLFVLSWILVEIFYKPTFWLFFPLLPSILYLHFKYKKQQIPIGMYQALYFFYILIIYFLMKV